jgi:hypothetical protein
MKKSPLAAICALALCVPAFSQTYIDPSDALGIWDFNSNAQATQSPDVLTSTPMVFQGTTAFSADAAGRSGAAGDRALNLGTTAGNFARVNDSNFMGLVNQSNLAGDQLTVVFWQKWSTAIANSSSVWFSSPNAAVANRGFQSHVPYGDGTVYFDTSGCCANPAQRINANISTLYPSFNWQAWHHIALVKNGGVKQVWVNGQILVSQASGASALLGDWTEMLVGIQSGASTSTVRGWIDDFAVFGTALNSTHINALYGGATPASLIVPADQLPPVISALTPSANATFHPPASGLSFNASTVSPNTIDPSDISLSLNGVNVTANLSIGGSATQRTITYTGTLLTQQYYTAVATVQDQADRTQTMTWSFDTADPALTPVHQPLPLATMGTPIISSVNGSAAAALALDGNESTIAETQNIAGSYWEMELNRSVTASRLVITAPSSPTLAGVLNGARVRLYNLRDQLVGEYAISSLAAGATWAAFLPAGTEARIIRLDFPPGVTNGLGDHRIAVAEVKLVGDASPAFGPLDLVNIGTVTQSSVNGTSVGGNALDGNPATIAQTTNVTGSFWELKLDRARRLDRIEIINAATTPARLSGLTLRVLDNDNNTLATTTLSNPGANATWSYDIPSTLTNARTIRIALENGALNGNGDNVISFADITLIAGQEYVRNVTSYMVRLLDSLPAASLANDGNYATHTETTTQSTDGWWEADLGSSRALYSVRAVPFDATVNQARLAKATLRLYDENHNSIYSQSLSGTNALFDIALPGPIQARYVRIGFENKQRSSSNGSVEWYLRLREVMAFGRPLGEEGITQFQASQTQVTAGSAVDLTWSVDDVRELSLYPNHGSMGAATLANGSGTFSVSPAVSTEYTLVGRDHDQNFIRHRTVIVDGQAIPPRISEICANNQFSYDDGYGDASDWIELRNPNASALPLAGYGLSDNPLLPMKWVFPAGTSIPANGTLMVFASNRTDGIDPKGNLHASFALSASGESVVLTAPNGTTTVDSILNFPAQEKDLTYGRDRDGNLRMMKPSPAAWNVGATYSGWLAAPTFSHSRGIHTTAFSLVLTNPNSIGQLLYSLDGSDPSIPYTSPLNITGSTTVRAQVIEPGYLAAKTVTHSFIFHQSVMTSPLMNATYTQGPLASRLQNSLSQLPTLCISVPTVPDDYNEREASLEVIMPDGSTPVQINAGLNRVGGSWTNFAKKSYRLSFRADYGQKSLDLPLFRGFDRTIPATDKVDTLSITAGNHDMVERGFYMANRFVEDTMLDMGSLNPHGRFVHVYINGVYWGQYNAHERLEDSFLADYLGGKTDDYVNVRGNDNVGDNFIIGTPEPPNRASWETVRANRNSYIAIKDRVDVSQLIDFMLVWYYGNCESEYRCAGSIEPGSGYKFWSADADGFLRTSALTLNRTANTGPGGIFGALAAEGHPDFKTLLADRIYKHFFNNGALTPESNTARLNARMAEIQDSLIAECARWGYRTPTNWESAAQTIRTGLFPNRTSNLFTMLKAQNYYPTIDPPTLSQHGGSVAKGTVVTLNSGTGTIYYTTDGSDPRLAGGGISPLAQTATITNTPHINLGASWKYFDQGSLPAANWNTSAYIDTAWASGNAPLGYGGGQTTTVSFGPNSGDKYRTTYFRKVINIPSVTAITTVNLGIARDDGAVVYVNGVEAWRSNMPVGAIGYSTFASSTISADKTTVLPFTIPASLLVNGDNLIAVEIHQSTAGSSDLWFDASLSTSSSPNIPINQNTQVKARLLNGSAWSALADAPFFIAHPLASGPYVFQEWADTNAAGQYPEAMRFMQTSLIDPPLAASMDTPWPLAYNLPSQSRISGMGSQGVAFVNTGDVQALPGAGFVGAAVVSLNTIGTQDIRVTWTGGTISPNTRDYGIRLQYRVGTVGAYQDVLDSLGQPVEYLRNATANHSQVIGPVTLPIAAENQPLVEVRWKYYYRSGSSGPRARLRIDDIQINAGPVLASSLKFNSVPQYAQAGTTCPPVVVEVRGASGALAQDYTGAITLALVESGGGLLGTLTRQATQGIAIFDDLSIAQPGNYTWTVSSSGLASDTSLVSTRVAKISSLVMPEFIQGEAPTNVQRVPFASLLLIEGLVPNATYRYAPQFVDGDDPATNEGAGNMIFRGDPFVRSTSSPRFQATDLLTRHAEFVTDAQGTFTGWFFIEPTNNIRFTAGNNGWLRILLNDGNAGDVTAFHLTAAPSIQVLDFGSSSTQGSAVYGQSSAAPRNVMVFYEDAAGATRPVGASIVEGSGILADANHAAFYRNEVLGQTGRWGTILPNDLSAGIRRIEERDGVTGAIVGANVFAQGHPLTTLMSGGSSALSLLVPAPAGSPFAHWQASRFILADLQTTTTAGAAQSDPDGDGVTNLLEFAFGMNPFVSSREGLPKLDWEDDNGSRKIVFRYRRLLGNHGLSYVAETSHTLEPWIDATSVWTGEEEVLTNPDGITETITRRKPMADPEHAEFFRMKVTEP